MEPKRKSILIPSIVLMIGILALLMFLFEIRDGVLQGSKSYGITRETDPVGFYISVSIEFLVGAGMTGFGVYMLRRKD